jgi:hypothetical protein
MKAIPEAAATLLVVTSTVVFFWGCRGSDRLGRYRTSAPFEITNGVIQGQSVWIVLATNGVSFTLFPNKVSVTVGTVTEATLWYDRDQAVFTNILLDTRDAEGQQQWVRDRNADGVPETRRQRGSKYSEAFLDGGWVPFRPGDGTYSIAMTATQEFRIHFEGTRWQRLP